MTGITTKSSDLSSRVAAINAEFAQRLDAIRAAIDEAKRRREEVAAAPVPRAVAIQRLDAELERAAATCTLSDTLYYLRGPEEPSRRLYGRFELASIEERGGRVAHNVDGALVRLLGPEIRKRLIVLLDADYAEAKAEGTVPLSDAERAEQLAALDAEIARLEREEVELLDAAAAAGLDLPPRADLSPAVFLDVDARELEAEQAADAGGLLNGAEAQP